MGNGVAAEAFEPSGPRSDASTSRRARRLGGERRTEVGLSDWGSAPGTIGIDGMMPRAGCARTGDEQGCRMFLS
jgi:hypothetical protein